MSYTVHSSGRTPIQVAAFVTFEMAYFAAKQACNFSWWTKGMQGDFLKFHYKGRERPLWIADTRMPFDII